MIANVNTNILSATLNVSLNTVNIRASNGNYVAANPSAPIMSNTHAIAKNYVQFALQSNPNKEI